jgi:hypothetical protein
LEDDAMTWLVLLGGFCAFGAVSTLWGQQGKSTNLKDDPRYQPFYRKCLSDNGVKGAPEVTISKKCEANALTMVEELRSLRIATDSLPYGIVGRPYSQQLAAEAGSEQGYFAGILLGT